MLSLTLKFLSSLVAVSTPAYAAYSLTHNYTSANFFSEFSFFTSPDPTHGFVQYSNLVSAASSTLIATAPRANNAVYLGVDNTNSFDPETQGRPSVRLVSNEVFNKGLFIADISHVPGSICGVWPAFWLVGPDWPNSGEIDIIEGVNTQPTNSMTLHTNAECAIETDGFTGTPLTSNCDVNAQDQDQNTGCSILHPSAESYGSGFNAIGGGIYATEWTSEAISIWFFPRYSIPLDIRLGRPAPSQWGTPVAKYSSQNCNIDQHFQNQQIVFDTTFCGDWAGKVWGQGQCASKAPTCAAFVAVNPEAFEDAFWLINKVEVYEVEATSVKRRRN